LEYLGIIITLVMRRAGPLIGSEYAPQGLSLSALGGATGTLATNVEPGAMPSGTCTENWTPEGDCAVTVCLDTTRDQAISEHSVAYPGKGPGGTVNMTCCMGFIAILVPPPNALFNNFVF
jgi:hypothetical protein